MAAVFYHLIKYVRDRSFDSKYLLSYIGKPFMGMILGSMVYLTECDERKVMFVGDFVFHERPATADESLAWNGGTEFNTDRFIDSLLRIQQIRVDVLLPGHNGFVLSRGSTLVDNGLVIALRAWGDGYAERRRV